MKTFDLTKAGGKIQHVLDNLFEASLKEHKKDGAVSVASLRETQRHITNVQDWGKLVVLAHHVSTRSMPKYIYHVAAAYEFLVLCVMFQYNELHVKEPELAVSHYPKEKQLHAQEGVNLVLGDVALVLMHSALSRIPASPDIILQYKKILGQCSKEVFLKQTEKISHDIYRTLFEQALLVGNTSRNKTFTASVRSFIAENKKEPGMKLVDSFLRMY